MMLFILKKKNNALILFTIFIVLFSLFENKANSFIPEPYEPNKKELEAEGKELGRSVEQLLYFRQYKQANKLAELAIKLNPSEDKLWAILAKTEIRLNKLKKARQSLTIAKNLNPIEASYWFQEALIDFEEKELKDSIKNLEKGLLLDPNNPAALFQLGNSRLLQKEYDKALIAFEKASIIKPNFWQSINNQALVLYELNKENKAIKLWEKVLIINKDAEPMLALAAANYSTNNNKNESISLAKNALFKNPNYVYIQHQEEQLWGKRLQKATQILFKDPELKSSIEKAKANANIKSN